MFVLIAGGGHVGRSVAESMVNDRHDVAVVERRSEVAARVAALGVRVIEGDAADPKVLQQAGISGADVVIAVTGEDEDNLVVCTLARFEFSVPRVIARVNDPRNRWMFDRDMGVDVALDQAELVATLVREEMTLEGLITILKLREADMALVEKPVASGSPLIGRTVADLTLPEDALAIAVLRGRRAFIPSSQLTLAEGDRILILTSVAQEQRLARMLSD